MTQTLKTLIPLTIVFAFLIATNFIYAAWTAPSGTPSAGNNALAPINVGSTDQVKTGGLFLDSLAVTGNALIQSEVRSPAYCDENGANCFSSASSSLGDNIPGVVGEIGSMAFLGRTGPIIAGGTYSDLQYAAVSGENPWIYKTAIGGSGV